MPQKDIEARRAYHREYQRKLREKKGKELLEYQKEWEIENKEKRLTQRRKRYAEKRDLGIKQTKYNPEYAKEFYLKNKDIIKEKQKNYRSENKDKIKSRNEKWYEKNKDYKKQLDKVWREKNKEEIDEKRKQRHWNLKLEVWSKYGTNCVCCGESKKEFLTIDHIEGGGVKHRKELRASGSQHIYSWLKKNDFPEGYRVLCMNCNFAFGMYGFCPHNLTEKEK